MKSRHMGVSAHLHKNNRRTGGEETERTGDAFIYSSESVSHFYLLLRVRGCICVSPCVRDEMLFTQVAVSALQLLCTTVNLRLIYPSLPHFWLIRTALSLCLALYTSAFQWRKDGAYSVQSDPNAPSLSSFEVI